MPAPSKTKGTNTDNRRRVQNSESECPDFRNRTPIERPRFTLPSTNYNMPPRSEEHTSELQSLMRISYAVFGLKKKIKYIIILTTHILYYYLSRLLHDMS